MIFNQKLINIVKVHGVFPSRYYNRASSHGLQFHRVNTRDSGAVVTSFMQASNYLAMNFATLGRSELPPPFKGLYLNNQSFE